MQSEGGAGGVGMAGATDVIVVEKLVDGERRARLEAVLPEELALVVVRVVRARPPAEPTR